MRLPQHIAMDIAHNQHKIYYETVEEYLGRHDWAPDELSDDDRAAMIAADSVWEIQWYPNTPVGFNIVYAATLERALELANKDNNE